MPDSEKIEMLKLDQNTAANLYTLKAKVATEKKFSDIAEVKSLQNKYYKRQLGSYEESGIEAYNDWFNKNHYEDGRGKKCIQVNSYYKSKTKR